MKPWQPSERQLQDLEKHRDFWGEGDEPAGVPMPAVVVLVFLAFVCGWGMAG